MKRFNIEAYLLVLSEIILIILFVFLFNQGHYVYAIVCFIGAILIWLFENGEVHLAAFWTLIITGAVLILSLENFLFGTVLILFGVAELFLNSALKGAH